MSEIITKQPATMEEYVDMTVRAVSEKVSSTGIVVPKGYALANGLQSAMLAIQQTVDKNDKPALTVCTPDSIKEFLLKVVQDGLYANKTHFYPVVYGNKLTMLTSYLGECYKLKQNNHNVKNIYSEIVYQGDVFKFKIVNGRKEITLHEQDIDNIAPEKIKGAYACVEFFDGTSQAEYMPLADIKKSWNFGIAKGDSKAHNLTTSEMCKKTVLRRLAKLLNATNNDSLFDQAEEIEEDHDSKANQDIIDIGGDDPICDADNPVVVTDSDMAGDVKEVDELEQLTLDDSAFDL
jgi:recombination protein RecT